MPIIKSAKKRVRIAEHKHAINLLQRAGAKTAVRNATRAIAAGANDATLLVQTASSKLDRAAQKRVIHPNKASRLKSRLAAKLKAAGVEQVTQTPKVKAKPAAKKKTTAKAKK